jgi:tRNA-dihydrouridine synthase B
MLLRHFALLRDYKGEYAAVREMRGHAAAYIKGLPRAAHFRCLFNMATESGEFYSLCERYEQQLLDKRF